MGTSVVPAVLFLRHAVDLHQRADVFRFGPLRPSGWRCIVIAHTFKRDKYEKCRQTQPRCDAHARLRGLGDASSRADTVSGTWTGIMTYSHEETDAYGDILSSDSGTVSATLSIEFSDVYGVELSIDPNHLEYPIYPLSGSYGPQSAFAGIESFSIAGTQIVNFSATYDGISPDGQIIDSLINGSAVADVFTTVDTGMPLGPNDDVYVFECGELYIRPSGTTVDLACGHRIRVFTHRQSASLLRPPIWGIERDASSRDLTRGRPGAGGVPEVRTRRCSRYPSINRSRPDR